MRSRWSYFLVHRSYATLITVGLIIAIVTTIFFILSFALGKKGSLYVFTWYLAAFSALMWIFLWLFKKKYRLRLVVSMNKSGEYEAELASDSFKSKKHFGVISAMEPMTGQVIHNGQKMHLLYLRLYDKNNQAFITVYRQLSVFDDVPPGFYYHGDQTMHILYKQRDVYFIQQLDDLYHLLLKHESVIIYQPDAPV